MKLFDALVKLPEEMIHNLKTLSYETMTEIQAETIPLVLSGRDLIAQAKTGSGKTAAFGVPLVLKIDTSSRDPQALIMTPTRELAEQVARELRRIARYRENLKILTLAGGVPMRGQIASLEQGVHIIVGTPGRLQDHLSRGTLPCFDIHTLILDEADRMLDMGFHDAIIKIISNFPKKRQTLLFSATFPDKIEMLAKSILRDPERITVDPIHTQAAIRQLSYLTETENRIDTLIDVFQSYRPESVLLFCNTRQETENVAEVLRERGFHTRALHGELDQRRRNETLLMFANGSIPVLAATDVASRGLDVKGIDMIVNYDLPHDPEVYTHRIGRTGRAGASGMAISLYTPSQAARLSEIAPDVVFEEMATQRANRRFRIPSGWITLCIEGGKKERLRAGDILGTLCKEVGLENTQIGKIDIFEKHSYVAIERSVADKAYRGLRQARIKRRKFRLWRLQ